MMSASLFCAARNTVYGLLIAFGAMLFGQQPVPDQKASGDPTPIEFHGSIRSRMEMWDWFGSGDPSRYAFSGNLLRLSVGQSGKHLSWKAEIAAPLLLRLPDDAQQPGSRGQLGLGATYYAANQQSRDAFMVFPRQVYLHLHHLGGSQRHGVRLGRFEFVDGTEAEPANPTLAALKRTRIHQRVLGSFGWTHVGRGFDGAHYTYDDEGQNLTLMAATPTRGVFQVDGWGWNKVAFAYGAFTQQIPHGGSATEVRLMTIHYTDWRNVLKADNRPMEIRVADRERIRIGSYGGHMLHARETGAGTLDFLLWGLVQSGAWGQQSHRAAAVAMEVGWQPAGLPALKPWLRAGYFRATGDGNPTDGKHTTFFQLMPTPRPYARFPFFDMLNNEDIHVGAVLRPHPRLHISSEAHTLRLSSRQDLWYLGGGVFQPWTFGYVGRPGMDEKKLASLFDISVDVRVTRSLTLNGYYGYALGGRVTRAIYPDEKNGSLALLEANINF